MSARTGGNGIPLVIKRATGVDVENAAIRCALGEPPLVPRKQCGNEEILFRGAGSLVFGSRIGGVLKNACSIEDVRFRVPEVLELHLSISPGRSVEPFEHNGNAIGFAVFDCESTARYAEIGAGILDALRIEIEACQV
jgi:hypothetical protein